MVQRRGPVPAKYRPSVFGGIMDEISDRERERRRKIGEASRKRWADPVWRAKISQKISDTMTELWKDPYHRQKKLAGLNNPVARKKMSEAAKEWWAKPGHKQKHSEKMERRWADPEWRARVIPKISEASSKSWQDPRYRQKVLDGLNDSIAREKMSEGGKKCWADPECRQRLLSALNDPVLRKKHIARMKKRWTDPEWRAKFIQKRRADMTKRWKDSKYRAQMSLQSKAFWEDTEYRVRMTEQIQQAANTSEEKARRSRQSKALWKDPEYREKVVRAAIAACHKTPNKLEVAMQALLDKVLPGEYRFVGNGEFILGDKNPDFLNVNGQKKLIEVYGDYWHRNDDPQDRIDLFQEFGFDTLVIWEHEIKDDLVKVAEKVLEFNG